MRFNILLIFLLLPAMAAAVVIDGIAAIVNDDVITTSEISVIDKLDLNMANLPERPNLLQSRIDLRLVLQQLSNQPPVSVSDEEITQAIASMEYRHGGPDKLQQFLGSIGMNYPDLEREIREQITVRNFVADRFRPFVTITMEEAEDFYLKVYKPTGELLGKRVASFEESFGEVQRMLVESRIKDRVHAWLEELRQTSAIYLKD